MVDAFFSMLVQSVLQIASSEWYFSLFGIVVVGGLFRLCWIIINSRW